MRDESILGFATALAATVAAGYAACSVLFYVFPGTAAGFMNALFHGLDFTRIQAEAAFTLSSFAYAGLVLTGWVFLLGCLFGWLRRKLQAPADAYVVSATMQVR